MVHGPCGTSRPQSPCMVKGKCSKYFPKKFNNTTTFDEDGYPIYRRRNTRVTTSRSGVELDNRFVVPYNPTLLMRYQAHINIECCNKSNSIKYLFKYINKGVDRVTVSLGNNEGTHGTNNDADEIKQYYDCRYLSPYDQVIVFKDWDRLDNVLHRHKDRKTMFLAWMEANKKYTEGQDLIYSDFPNHFVYDVEAKEWRPRQRGFSIGRMNYIPPGVGELYYLRLLLNVQRGPTSYECLKTVDGVTHDTFRDACGALGLLDDDKEFIDGINEASKLASSSHLRKLFVTLLMSNSMSSSKDVWEKMCHLMVDDILHGKRIALHCPDLHIPEHELHALCLLEINNLLMANGKTLRDYRSMPSPTQSSFPQFSNVLIFNELNFNTDEMRELHDTCFPKLNAAQLSAYNRIVHVVEHDTGGLFFVYGHGGTGKTFLWRTLSYKFRSDKRIVLNVASSGIASLLLPGGRTTHSQFCIPLSLNEDSCCAIKQGTPKAELLEQTSLIIWDEAPMVNKWAFEALDRTLKDIMRFVDNDCDQKPFGGKVVVLGGDFQQILPVGPKGSRAEIVMSTINSSYLWKHCTVLRLMENMRLTSHPSGLPSNSIKLFSEWILDLGNGTLGTSKDGKAIIEIPSHMLIPHLGDPINDVVSFTYPDLVYNCGEYNFFQDKAILAPTLEIVDTVNQFVMSMIPCEEKVYLSCDSISKVDVDTGVKADWLTTEFLNSIRCSGMPNHKLVLKKGIPIMLMRNIDISAGLCNGTRLIVVELGTNVIGAKVVTGENVETLVYIPRMNLVPSDHLTPLKFQRRQFPICISFAMTINKSQGQTLSRVGVFLPRPVFTHGQLYVAVSKVKCPTGLKIVVCDDLQSGSNTTTNVVYNEVFQKI